MPVFFYNKAFWMKKINNSRYLTNPLTHFAESLTIFFS